MHAVNVPPFDPGLEGVQAAAKARVHRSTRDFGIRALPRVLEDVAEHDHGAPVEAGGRRGRRRPLRQRGGGIGASSARTELVCVGPNTGSSGPPGVVQVIWDYDNHLHVRIRPDSRYRD